MVIKTHEGVPVKKEKHNWKIQRQVIMSYGDDEHHYVAEYLECSECGAKKVK